MNPFVRLLGRMLRLVGISSPEDSLPREKTEAGPPSWRDHAPPQTNPDESGQPGKPEPRS